jgi:hypothetical protein
MRALVLLILVALAGSLRAEERAAGLHKTERARRLLAIAKGYLPKDWRYPVTEAKLTAEQEKELLRLLPVTARAQPNGYTCGPASLGILLTFYGRNVDTETAGKAVHVTEDGVDPEDLVKGAEELGFDVSARYNASHNDVVAALTAEKPVIIDYQASYGPDDDPNEDSGHYSVVVASDETDLLIVDCSETNPYHLRIIPRDKLADIWWDTYIDQGKPNERFDRWMMTVSPRPPRAAAPGPMTLLGVPNRP